jgi:SAM-dependent methyltransferase
MYHAELGTCAKITTGIGDVHVVKSKGWDWENVNEAYRATHLKPTEDCQHCAETWKHAGYESVLDLGAGLGRHSICFAKNGLKTSAFDISEYGINHLQTWAETEKVNIETTIGDMLSLPYADNSFDCVFAYHVISHSDSIGIKIIIKEIERVLKPKGAVYLSFSSKETDDYVYATRPKADENTMLWEGGADIGGLSPIFYANIPDIVGQFNIATERSSFRWQNRNKEIATNCYGASI